MNYWPYCIRFHVGLYPAHADALISTGLADLGYVYVNIDDCWCRTRNSEGQMVPDPKTFPSGIKALAEYIHEKGLKLGIYSDAGGGLVLMKWGLVINKGSSLYDGSWLDACRVSTSPPTLRASSPRWGVCLFFTKLPDLGNVLEGYRCALAACEEAGVFPGRSAMAVCSVGLMSPSTPQIKAGLPLVDGTVQTRVGCSGCMTYIVRVMMSPGNRSGWDVWGRVDWEIQGITAACLDPEAVTRWIGWWLERGLGHRGIEPSTNILRCCYGLRKSPKQDGFFYQQALQGKLLENSPVHRTRGKITGFLRQGVGKWPWGWRGRGLWWRGGLGRNVGCFYSGRLAGKNFVCRFFLLGLGVRANWVLF
ncbi:unnamed protein product [Prunus armeniaca]|uniref:Alpha-galactosidase n=1 Tax=Prunus armeniaca TaxID=36596 RepID=A0A6J5WX82_PRUAR|nr:unnamed protein product [Prunus armeniaca]